MIYFCYNCFTHKSDSGTTVKEKELASDKNEDEDIEEQTCHEKETNE